MIDHKAGYFTEKLIVGQQGSLLNLSNSDDVGHTIYVRDRKKDIKWQLNYMPPGSSFDQELFWDDDIFVEMRCRLHLYMSAWAGSISSKYHKVVEFREGEIHKTTTMRDFPAEFSEVKIWMPPNRLIQTIIRDGETQEFDLGVSGKLVLARVP